MRNSKITIFDKEIVMRKKILFIYTNYSSFVKTDFEILSSEHDVIKYQFKPVKGLFKTGIEFIKQFLYLLFNIWKFDSVFIWFADYHSVLPVLFTRILNKKSFVVIGGYDVAKIPSLNYGVFISKIRGFCAIYSMNTCTKNLTVSNYVDRKVRWIAKKSVTRMIYNCVNISNSDSKEIEKENLIITVGIIDSDRTFLLKGIDTFIEVARLLPEHEFMIIGANKNMIKNLIKNMPDNLEIVGRINHTELIHYYKRAKIYCQFSRTESFGVSIVEAMNFGCVPVVTNIGGMPEIVENARFVVKRNMASISELIQRTIYIKSGDDISNFQNEIIKFSLRNRKKYLHNLLIS